MTRLKNANGTAGVTYSDLSSRLTTTQAGLELNIRDYAGFDPTGATDMAGLINTATSDASVIATAGGYQYVTLGGFGRANVKVNSRLFIRDKVRLALDEARLFAGADFPTQGFFHALEAQATAVAQGTGTTTNGNFVIASVSSPSLWQEGDLITGTGIPANTRIKAVDIANSKVAISKAATGSASVTLTKAATYYGSHRNAGIIGGEIDPNGFAIGEGIRALWTENFVLEGTRFRHDTRKAGDEDWAVCVGGRDVLIKNVEVVGGRLVFQDGIHFVHGQRCRIEGCTSESGDDAYAIGSDMFSTLVTQADPIRAVTLVGNVAKSNRGFALKVYSPVPSAPALSNGWTAADYGATDVVCDGLTGYSGRLRNGGVAIIDVNAGVIAGTVDNVKGVHVNGVALDVGGPLNDGVNAYGAWVASVTDVSVRGTINCTDIEGAADAGAGVAGGGFRGVYVRDCIDIETEINQLNTGKAFAVELRQSKRVTVAGTMKQGSAGTNSMIFIRDCSDAVIRPRLVDVQSGEIGIEISGLSVKSTVTVDGGFIQHKSGASAGSGISAASSVCDRLDVLGTNLAGAFAPWANLTNIQGIPAVNVVSVRGVSTQVVP